jgi:hypothetical protein
MTYLSQNGMYRFVQRIYESGIKFQRDIYYKNPNLFKTQAIVDRVSILCSLRISSDL